MSLCCAVGKEEDFWGKIRVAFICASCDTRYCLFDRGKLSGGLWVVV